MLSAVGSQEWEKLTLTVDSGASDTVAPPTVCKGAQLHKDGEKYGIEYEIADGSSIENLGERHCLMKTIEKGGEVFGQSEAADLGDADQRVRAQEHH